MERLTYRQQEATAKRLAMTESSQRQSELAAYGEPLKSTLAHRICWLIAERAINFMPDVRRVYLNQLPSAERTEIEQHIKSLVMQKKQQQAAERERQRKSELELQPGLLGMFDPVSYWAGKPVKKWVVTVTNHNQIDTLYVASATEQGAKRHGKTETRLTGRLRISARLATPDDLGANHRDDNDQKTMWV
ncbi:hypothetical protein [Oceanobacter sp. 4_MG-2023]|uniref:hypothetical protein n=1 Tax=Oceanobacter sp. 4_MG-2023 TaxID=3062623 RepID=UPI0027376F0D|nr:hypothetical protein [Oceanobacter sp. 4_MG-2023]MDP2548880.1 hypothetical protein [Oceanobacter sp. 4_MG-2023]